MLPVMSRCAHARTAPTGFVTRAPFPLGQVFRHVHGQNLTPQLRGAAAIQVGEGALPSPAPRALRLPERATRSFSDFEWLRLQLHARYVGVCVPPLPDKGGLSGAMKKSVDSDFIVDRMRMLSEWAPCAWAEAALSE